MERERYTEKEICRERLGHCSTLVYGGAEDGIWDFKNWDMSIFCIIIMLSSHLFILYLSSQLLGFQVHAWIRKWDVIVPSMPCIISGWDKLLPSLFQFIAQKPDHGQRLIHTWPREQIHLVQRLQALWLEWWAREKGRVTFCPVLEPVFPFHSRSWKLCHWPWFEEIKCNV